MPKNTEIKRPAYPIALFLIFLFESSCREPKELVYRDFKNLKVEKLAFGASTLNVDLIYYNPNNFGLQLKTTDLDIFIDNNYLGHSSQDLQINIPRLAEFTLPLQIEVDMKNALKNALPTLLGKEVLVRVTGKVKLGKANVYKTFTVNYESVQKFSAF
jgi:LEA14-like dessication related protein